MTNVRLIEKETTVLVLLDLNLRRILLEMNWLSVKKKLVELLDVKLAIVMIRMLVKYVLIPTIMKITNAINAVLGAMIVVLLQTVIIVWVREKLMIVLVLLGKNLRKTQVEMNYLNAKKKLVE